MTNLDQVRPNVEYETVDIFQKYEESWLQLSDKKRIMQ
jgi:hypothetical protein